MNFGEKVKSLRKKRGYSQPQLAKIVDVTMRTVQNYEASRSFPQSGEILMRLCSALETSADYLVSDRESFVMQAQNEEGPQGKKEAEDLVSQIGGLFAGGHLMQEDMDKVFKALTDIYWEAKENNKKYSKKSFT